MVFGFFSRKPQSSTQQAASTSSTTVPAERNAEASVPASNVAQEQPEQAAQSQLRTPSPSVQSMSHGKPNSPHFQGEPFPAPGPAVTPSPAPEEPEHALVSDPTSLYTLVLSVPPKAFQDYTLSHLIKSDPPPSPKTLTKLTKFFSSMTPPPLLHCVRCHKDYYEAQNSDQSCLIAHDDESAEVERVGSSKKGKAVGGYGTEYETLWGCCGKVVEGDGDMGPPDGWCYEGKHTTDVKRARFRADSTPHDDKLSSCEKMRCNGLTRTRSTRFSRKRGRVDSVAEEQDAQQKPPSTTSHTDADEEPAPTPAKRPVKRQRTKSVVEKSVLKRALTHNMDEEMKSFRAEEKGGDTDVEMEVDQPVETPARSRAKPLSRPSRAKSKSKMDIDAPADANPTTPAPASKTRSAKPRSSASTASSKPRANVAQRTGVLTPKASPGGSTAHGIGSPSLRPYVMLKSRDSTPSRVTASRSAKALDEIVDGSVDGEVALMKT